MIGGRLAVRAVIAGLLCLGIAGCSGDDDRAPPSSTVTTTTADPIPSSVLPTAPVRPSDEATPESAEDFVKYFWQTYNYAYATHETDLLSAISADACSYCASAINDVRQVAAGETEIQGHDVTIADIVTPQVKITTRTVVQMTGNQAPGLAIASSGKTAKLLGRKNTRFVFALKWQSGRWQVEGVNYDSRSGQPWSG